MEHKDKPFISDEALLDILDRIHTGSAGKSEVQLYQHTPDQVIMLCREVVSRLSVNVLNGATIPPNGVDILLGSEYAGDRLFLLDNDVPLSADQLLKLMADKNQYIRQKAYCHPKCTDEQKVKYHLMRGDE